MAVRNSTVVRVSTRIEHTARRPFWNCRVDGQPWPCPEARRKIARQAQRHRTVVCMYLGSIVSDMRAIFSNSTPPPRPSLVISWLGFSVGYLRAPGSRNQAVTASDPRAVRSRTAASTTLARLSCQNPAQRSETSCSRKTCST